MNQNNQLQPGAYPLPPDCKAFVRDGQVIVSLKKAVTATRCRDCLHFGYGYATAGGRRFTEICRARPKSLMCHSRGVKEAEVYYTAHSYDKVCDKYEPRTSTPGQ